MRWLFTTLSIGSVTLCVMAASGCSNETRNSPAGQNAHDAAEPAEPGDLEPSSFVRANWALDAEPGAVRLHQRIDPVTGRKVDLSEEQSALSEDDGQSVLERQAAKKHQDARGRQTTFGDPTGNVQAIR